MKLSEYEQKQNENYIEEYRKKCEIIVDYFMRNTEIDLIENAKSKDAIEIYEKLKVWLLKFHKIDLLCAFKSINYSYTDFQKSLIMSFIMTICKNKEKSKIIFEVLMDNSIVLDVEEYKDGGYKVITNEFGNITFYPAMILFRGDREVERKVTELGERLKDSCHEISYFLIKRYENFKAITGIMEKDLNYKFYHTIIKDEYDYIIDLPNGVAMPIEDYFKINTFVELNEVNFNQCEKESEISRKYDESGTLYDLLRNAIYKSIK